MDNLPSYVARSIIHFEKYTKGLSKVCSEIMSNESTPELRKDLLEKIEESVQLINQNRDMDCYEKTLIEDTINKLQK